jgi:hypothetical protein
MIYHLIQCRVSTLYSFLYCVVCCIVFCAVLCSVVYLFCTVLCSVLYCVLYCIVLFRSLVYLVFLLYNAVAISRVPVKQAGQTHLLACYIFCNAAAFCCVSGVAASIVCLVSQQVAVCLVSQQVAVCLVSQQVAVCRRLDWRSLCIFPADECNYNNSRRPYTTLSCHSVLSPIPLLRCLFPTAVPLPHSVYSKVTPVATCSVWIALLSLILPIYHQVTNIDVSTAITPSKQQALCSTFYCFQCFVPLFFFIYFIFSLHDALENLLPSSRHDAYRQICFPAQSALLLHQQTFSSVS